MSRPPRLARALLSAALPARVRSEVLGDLEERFVARRSRGSGARLWYWRAALACAVRLGIERARGGLRSVTPLLSTLDQRPVNESPPVSTRMQSLLQDIRYATRALTGAPGFAAVAIITLALAVGANTALFSLVNGVLLAPLPYEEPAELVNVWSALTARDVERFPLSFPMLKQLRDHTAAFEHLAGVVSSVNAIAGEEQEPERIPVGWVSWNLFSTLGVSPILGRSFTPDDAVPGGFRLQLVNQAIAEPRVALLSHEAWQSRFGGVESAIGESFLLDGRRVEVVGVLPEGFRLYLPPGAGVPEEHEIYVPLRPDFATAPLANVMLSLVGRIDEAASLEQARIELEQAEEPIIALNDVLATAGYELRMARLDAELSEKARPALLALMGAVGFVLLIACANISTLLLVRATGRQQEMAVRSALGGSRGRLVRQMITESLLLGLVGGGLGVALAWLSLEPLMALQPADLPRAANVGLDGTVLVFSLAASVAAALLFGVLPALQSSRPKVIEALRTRIATGDRAQQWARNGVVVAQVALSMVLLVGAGLMVRSFVNLQGTDPGFDPEGVLKVTVDLPAAEYPEPGERNATRLRLKARLEAIAGVESVSGGLPVPLDGGPFWGRYGTEEALGDPSRFRQANYRLVMPDYLETMGARLVAGRPLTRADYLDAAPNVLVDTLLAEKTWPGESAVGKRLWVRPVTDEPVPVEVVGVVEPEYFNSLAAPGPEAIYFPISAVPFNLPDVWLLRTSRADPLSLVPEVRAAVREIDPMLPVAETETMRMVVDDSLGGTRGTLTLIALFGAIAATMAAIGLYGVIAYSVRQRTAEMGIRMALGAAGGDIRSLVLGQGVKLALVGIVLGLGGAFALTRTMSSLLAGVAPTDPLTFGVTAVAFMAVATLATGVPALRATRIDPIEALNPE